MLTIASLLAGYIACTTPKHLDAEVIDTAQCLATDDIRHYPITTINYHGDKAEITIELPDDATANLWIYRDALDGSKTE